MSKNQFVIEGKLLHQLDKVSDPKSYTIKINDHEFHYTLVQVVFISIEAFEHFRHFCTPFNIEIPSGIDSEDIFLSFVQLDSLLHTNGQLILNKNNVNSFKKLGEILKNLTLLSACEDFQDSTIKTFRLSTKQLLFISKKKRDTLNDFEFAVNSRKFSINYSLFCCVSKRITISERNSNKYKLTLSSDAFACFSSFIKIFDGSSFDLSQYNFSVVMSLVECLELHCLKNLMVNGNLIPTTLDQAISFLSKAHCSFFSEAYGRAISILVENLNKLTFKKLNTLSLIQLESIFSSLQLKTDHEDTIFTIILQLISADHNRISLLRLVEFAGVSSQVLHNFLKGFSVEYLNSDLFESLKIRLVSDIAAPSRVKSGRWLNPPTIISRSDIEKLNDLLSEHFKEKGDIVKQTEKLLDDKFYLQKRNADLVIENEQLKKEVFELSHPLVVGKNVERFEHYGINFELRKISGNFVHVAASGSYGGCDPRSVLIYNNAFWRSRDSENSWILFRYHDYKLKLSGYLLRSICETDWALKGWRLEGSVDGEEWAQLDEKMNETSLEEANTDVMFPCECRDYYSVFKLTQTQMNSGRNDYFQLAFIEFFGTFMIKSS